MTIVEVLTKYGEKAIIDAKSILSNKGKGNSKLAKSMKIKKLTGRVGIKISMNDYAKWVDKGRKKGKRPPLNVIEKWCKKKGINKKAAFNIARAIGRRGIKPTNFLDPVYRLREEILPALLKNFKEELNKEKLSTTKITYN